MAEVAFLVAAAGWILGPNIKDFMEWVRSKVGDIKDMEDNRQKVAEALESMRSNVDAMKKCSITGQHTRRRLWEFQDEIQGAVEEFMDKFHYEVIEAANQERTRTTRRKIFNGSAKKLKQLLNRLKDKEKTSEDLLKILQQANPPSPHVTTTSKQRAKKLFGYDKELDDLVSELTSVGGGTRVVGIIGHGGIGKTELAQWAFNHPETEAKFGKLPIWVSVSGMVKPEDLLKIYDESTDTPGAEMGRTHALRETELKDMIAKANRPYLLVLDDVCNDETTSDAAKRKATWETVLAPFIKQQKDANNNGSRILLTSRAQICLDTLARCMDADAEAPPQEKIVLNGIKNTAQLMDLLMQEARQRTRVESVLHELNQRFQTNVAKFHGSPSAARKFVSNLTIKVDNKRVDSPTVGIRREWKNGTMERRIEDVLVEDHLSSFEVLPPHLQRCFAFCSIFPKGWKKFEKEKLTRMWIALGFVEAPSTHGGRDYFDDLVERSLFQQVGDTSCYEIHEHIHSMIRTVCPDYYHRIDRRSSGTVPIPSTVGHLSVTTACLDQLQAAVGLRRLRTLLVFDEDDEDDAAAATSSRSSTGSSTKTDDILNKLIHPQKREWLMMKKKKNKFKGVRVLDLSNTTGITAVPSGIGELEHLRYLGLPSTIGCISEDVTKLLPLQTLSADLSNLRTTDNIDTVLQYMSRLINLRHLDLGKEEYVAWIAGIGSMRMLQSSVEFHVRRTEPGHKIKELGGLNSLHQKLTIKCLDKVESREEAESANLGVKVHLETLELEWAAQQSDGDQYDGDGAARQPVREVLEGLQPHPNLEDLKIQNYAGTESPSWFLVSQPVVSLNLLRSLKLINCPKLNILSLGAFPALRTMVLADMAELVAWEGGITGDGNGDGSGSGSAAVLLPNLREVNIVRCPKFTSLFDGLLCCRHSLRRLHVEGCPAVVHEEFDGSRFHPDLQLSGELRFKEQPRPPRADYQMRDRQEGDRQLQAVQEDRQHCQQHKVSKETVNSKIMSRPETVSNLSRVTINNEVPTEIIDVSGVTVKGKVSRETFKGTVSRVIVNGKVSTETVNSEVSSEIIDGEVSRVIVNGTARSEPASTSLLGLFF